MKIYPNMISLTIALFLILDTTPTATEPPATTVNYVEPPPSTSAPAQPESIITSTTTEPQPIITSTTTEPPTTITDGPELIITTTTTEPPTTTTTTTPPPTTTTTTTLPPTTTTTTTTPEPTTTTTTTTTTQRPTEAGKCTQKMDLAFIIDASTSICGSTVCKNWQFNLDFVRNVISDLIIGPDDTRVAIITFADNAVLTFYLDAYQDKDSLLKAANTVVYTGGQTNTTGAFKLLLSDIFVPQHGDRPNIPNTAIIITDGVPNVEANLLKDTVAKVFQKQIRSLAVGVTNNVKDNVLKLISSPPGELNINYFKAQSYDSLDKVRTTLAEQTCQSA